MLKQLVAAMVLVGACAFGESVVFDGLTGSSLAYGGGGSWSFSLNVAGVSSIDNATPTTSTSCLNCKVSFTLPVSSYSTNSWAIGSSGTFSFTGTVHIGAATVGSGGTIVDGVIGNGSLLRQATVAGTSYYVTLTTPIGQANYPQGTFNSLLTALGLPTQTAATPYNAKLNLIFTTPASSGPTFSNGSSIDAGFALDGAPEPATVGLIALGSLVVLAVKRRRV